MLLGLNIVTYVKNAALKLPNQCLVLVYFIIFLEKNNLNWKKASFITYSILNKINEKKHTGEPGKIFFLNIPNEIEGAYVFRLGFPDALKLYGFDSSRYFAVNYLPRQDLEKMKKESSLLNNEGKINLPPDIVLKQRGPGNLRYPGSWRPEIHHVAPGGTNFFTGNINRLDEEYRAELFFVVRIKPADGF